MGSESLTSARCELADYDEVLEAYHDRGWTDGLPVVPPTPEKVWRFVEAAGRDAAEIVGRYPSRRREISVEKVAINAVMAGCKPEYFPVVLAVIEAMADPDFGIHAANATTGGSAIGFVVNGPIRRELGMNYRGNVFGPGNRANSTIGRAVRLTQINVLGSVPGAGGEDGSGRPILDRATMGQPGKYAGYHLPENEEDFPSLRPLHVERGYAAEQSVVTVFATGGHMQISAHAESTGQAIIDTIAHYLVGTGRLTRFGFCVLAIPPENAAILVRDGWSKADIRKSIFEGTSRSVAWAKRNGWQAGDSPLGGRGGTVGPGDEDRTIAISGRPEDVLVVVAGGSAGAFVHALLPYGGPAVSRVIRAA